MPFATIPEAVEEFRAGRMLVIVDDEDRENEGDVTIAAEMVTAADRAHTIRVAIHPDSRPGDLARPGHVFPLRAREGGVLVRAGQTEAVVDMAKLAGLRAG